MANATPVTGRASIPSEANSQGGINETTPASQRTNTTDLPMSAGPDIGEKGEYRPAVYKQEFTSEATADRPARTHTLIRNDR